MKTLSARVVGRGGAEGLQGLNRYQTAFCQWNAERLGIPLSESAERFLHSSRSFRGGHRGRAYRRFCDLSHRAFRAFFSDSAEEVFEAYRFHAQLHLLRMLSYGEPRWSDRHPVITALAGERSVTICDFGCGLAQPSISLSERLMDRGVQVSLHLFDIDTLRLEFLRWFCQRSRIDAEVVACSEATPIPPIPPTNVIFAEEFFEHVYQPLDYVRVFDASLKPGGLLLAKVHDHRAEFMHVHPSLEGLRDWLDRNGYHPVRRGRIFRKQRDESAAAATGQL